MAAPVGGHGGQHIWAWVVYNPRSGGISYAVRQSAAPTVPQGSGLAARRMMIGVDALANIGAWRVAGAKIRRRARAGLRGSLI